MGKKRRKADELLNTAGQRGGQGRTTGGGATIPDDRPITLRQRRLQTAMHNRGNGANPVVQAGGGNVRKTFRQEFMGWQYQDDDRRRTTLENEVWGRVADAVGHDNPAAVRQLLEGKGVGDGKEFLALVARTADKDASSLYHLFVEGADLQEVEAMLQIEPNACTICQLMSRSPGTPSINDIQFVSVDHGKVGSIYFANGRVRLVHPDGPAVQVHPTGLKRYVVDEEMKQDLIHDFHGTYLNNILPKEEEYLLNPSNLPATGILYEVLVQGKDFYPHDSRGTPQPFRVDGFKQRHFNLLYNIGMGLSEKLKSVKKQINKIGDLNMINSDIEDYGTDMSLLNREEKQQLETLKAQKAAIEKLQQEKPTAIANANTTLARWIAGHPVLRGLG